MLAGIASSQTSHEIKALKRACDEIRRSGSVSDDVKDSLRKSFDKRSGQALALVDSEKVKMYRFVPSGRIIWSLTGREKEYQVVPDSMFCTCDDYYFRVMGKKRELCYHLLAQFIAEAAHKYSENVRRDSEYAEFTAKWKPRERS